MAGEDLSVQTSDLASLTLSDLDERFQETTVDKTPALDYLQVQDATDDGSELTNANEGFFDTLRFELTRLEAALYAVCGAIPKSYELGQQWQDHDDPRCLWPEQKFIYDHPVNPVDWIEKNFQVAANGEHGDHQGNAIESDSGYIDWSRSGCFAEQWLYRYHGEQVGDVVQIGQGNSWFPAGSVTRTSFAGSNYDDPSPSDQVRISYTAPSSKRSLVNTVTLRYRKRVKFPSEGSWTTGNIAMTSAGSGLYYADIPTQAEFTELHFYLDVLTNETVPQHLYDPCATSGTGTVSVAAGAPSWGTIDDKIFSGKRSDQLIPGAAHQQNRSTYHIFVMTHKAPYKGGLPEFWWEYCNDESFRRCTGVWRIERIEDVRSGLINAARFALASLGYWFQHHPGHRGNNGSCCIDMPITWRWSGANVPGHYQDLGKEESDDAHRLMPAHDVDTVNDIDPSRTIMRGRFTWRGSSLGPHGGDESWLSWPIYVRQYDTETQLWSGTAHERGLREGDRITLTHCRELIDDIRYIVDFGLWFHKDVITCKKTPTRCGGVSKVDYMESYISTRDPDHQRETYGGCYAVMLHELGGPVNFSSPNTTDCELITAGQLPESAHVSAGQCSTKGYWIYTRTGFPILGNYDLESCGDPSVGEDVGASVYQRACGQDFSSMSLYTRSAWYTSGTVFGYARYVCPPKHYTDPVGDAEWSPNYPKWNAIDDQHGNTYHKYRKDRDVRSMGNGAWEALSCDGSNDTTDLSFSAVTSVQWNGIAHSWGNSKTQSSPCEYGSVRSTIPSLPGLGYYGWPDDTGKREPLCGRATLESADLPDIVTYTCGINEYSGGPNCAVNGTPSGWFRVDLDLDGNNVPRLRDHIISIKGLDEDGDRYVPDHYPDSVGTDGDNVYDPTLIV